jgi:hypothetical protein
MAQPVVCASKANPFVTFIFKGNQATEVQVMFIKLFDGKVVLVLMRGLH